MNRTYPTILPRREPPIDHDEVTISLYENEVPSFVSAELDQLYENLFSSMTQFRVYGSVKDASTYLVRKNDKTITIFLFRQQGGRVDVINEVIRVEEQDVSHFAEYIFSTFKSVTVISFHAIQTDIRRLPFPYQRVNVLENIVLTLPKTADAYLASLGKATRKTIKGNMNKLKRNFPSFGYTVYTKDELTEQQIRDIIALNKARMAGKNKTSAYDELETARITHLAKECGLIGIVTIDGRICAGAISFQIGQNYFMRVNAHDPAYDGYRLGMLCGFLIISACIDRGGRECHLLWGQHEYKFRFLGVQRDLDNLAIYRSYGHMLRNGDTVLKAICTGYARQAALWLHASKQRDSWLWRMANASLNGVRSMRRLIQGAVSQRK